MKDMKKCSGGNVYTKVPDGGWGWAVAVAFFFVEVFTYGVIKSFGVFFKDLMIYFEESNSRISWIISICVFVLTFTAPISTVLSNRFGHRPVVMLGGFLISVGMMMASFARSVVEIYVSIGVVSGLGYCLSFLPTVTILSQYFDKRRSLVTAVASTGECFAVFAFAPAITALSDQVGWRYCLLMVGALQLNIVVCGALLRPIIIKAQEETKELPKPENLESAYMLENEQTLTSLDSIDSGVEVSTSPKTVPSNVKSDTRRKSAMERPEVAEQADSWKRPEVAEQAESWKRPEVAEQADSWKRPEVAEQADSWKRPEVAEQADSWKRPEVAEQADSWKRPEVAEQADSWKRPEVAEQADSCKTPPLLDFSVLRNSSFMCYALFGLFATLGFFAPSLYIIPLSLSLGIDKDLSAYMLSAMAIAEVFGRIGAGWLLNKKPIRKVYIELLFVVLLCFALIAFPFACSFWGLMMCSMFFGCMLGTVTGTHIPLVAEEDIVGIEKMSSGVGVYVFIQSIAGLAGPPLGGMLVDYTQNYGSAFYSCAVGMALGAFFLALVRPCRTGFCQRKPPLCQGTQEMPDDFLEMDMSRGEVLSKSCESLTGTV